MGPTRLYDSFFQIDLSVSKGRGKTPSSPTLACAGDEAALHRTRDRIRRLAAIGRRNARRGADLFLRHWRRYIFRPRSYQAVRLHGIWLRSYPPVSEMDRATDSSRSFSFPPRWPRWVGGRLEFFAPEKKEHVSYSAQPAPKSDLSHKILAPVKPLQQLVEELGTSVPHVLKMDIEGFEYAVIDDVLAGPLRPHQWLIEFHHRMYGIGNDRTEAAVAKLRGEGYRLFYVSEGGHEYGFVRR